MDDLAAALATLLAEGPARTAPLSDLPATLAARDTVLVELRELVGTVSQAPRFGVVRELTVFDVVERPGQALHQVLSELPRAVSFGTSQLSGEVDLTLGVYEQHWHRAARAMIGLEGFLPGLAQLPDLHAWNALRELADVAASMPYLDHDLAGAVLPPLKAGQDLAVPYRQLSAGHDAVRLTAGEIRARIPAPEHSARPAAAGPFTGGDLGRAVDDYARVVAGRAGQLSVPDLRAVARLLQFGSRDAGRVLDRSSVAVDGAADTAFGLVPMRALAAALRDSAIRSTSVPHLDVIGGASELVVRMATLGELAGRMPGGASDQDLRRLAAPALEFAATAPMLVRTLQAAVRESLRTGSILIPNRSDRHWTSLSWVTAQMGPRREGPPAVQRVVDELASAAARLGPAVRCAQTDLRRHQSVGVDPAKQALLAARSHAGAARGQLRATLARRITDHASLRVAVGRRIRPGRCGLLERLGELYRVGGVGSLDWGPICSAGAVVGILGALVDGAVARPVGVARPHAQHLVGTERVAQELAVRQPVESLGGERA
jgi:hypothetical protein